MPLTEVPPSLPLSSPFENTLEPRFVSVTKHGHLQNEACVGASPELSFAMTTTNAEVWPFHMIAAPCCRSQILCAVTVRTRNLIGSRCSSIGFSFNWVTSTKLSVNRVNELTAAEFKKGQQPTHHEGSQAATTKARRQGKRRDHCRLRSGTNQCCS